MAGQSLAGRPKTRRHRERLRASNKAHAERVRRALKLLADLERRGIVTLDSEGK